LVTLAGFALPAGATFPGKIGMVADDAIVRVGNEGGQGIVVRNADGTGLETLALGSDPSWSPDGNTVVFDSIDRRLAGARGYFPSGIATVDAAGGHLNHLDPSCRDQGQCFLAEHPSWSPDGRIVFECRSDQSSPFGICVMNADGSQRRQLAASIVTSPYGDEGPPIWSPDGHSIVFSANPDGTGVEDAWEMNADGSGARRILPNAFDLQWLPDSRGLVGFDRLRQGSGVFIAGADGTGRREVPLPPGAVDETGFPTVLPDGRIVVNFNYPDGRHLEFGVDPVTTALTQVPDLPYLPSTAGSWQPCVQGRTARCTTSSTGVETPGLRFVKLRGNLSGRVLTLSGTLGPAGAPLPHFVTATATGLPKGGWKILLHGTSFSGERTLSAVASHELRGARIEVVAGTAGNVARGTIFLPKR
jgi:hypothetical protein